MRGPTDPVKRQIIASYFDILTAPRIFGVETGPSLPTLFLPAGFFSSDMFRDGRFSVVTAVVVLTGLGLFVVLQARDRDECWRQLSLTLWLLVGAIGYFCVLLAAYMYSFGEYEGTRLASFDRYASTYLLTGVLSSIAVLTSLLEGGGWRRVSGMAVMLVVTMLAVLTCRGEAWLFLTKPVTGLTNLRVAIERFVHPLTSTSLDTRVYHIWQDTNGFLHRISSYELSPRPANSWCWTVGEPYNPADVWTCRISAKEFAASLSSYDYLLIGHADAAFWERFGALFDPQGSRDDGVVWRVVPDAAGSVRLTTWTAGS